MQSNTPAPKAPEKTKTVERKEEAQKKRQSLDDTAPNLPTPDHVAAKENAERPPNDETMSDQPGTYRVPPERGPGRPNDNNTMSDQPGAKRSLPN